MSNWRPEGWDESSEATAKQCAEDEKFKVANLENVIRGMFETGADAMLLKVCEEIEKVENPHPATVECADEDGVICTYNNLPYITAEDFRQTILALLK